MAAIQESAAELNSDGEEKAGIITKFDVGHLITLSHDHQKYHHITFSCSVFYERFGTEASGKTYTQ